MIFTVMMITKKILNYLSFKKQQKNLESFNMTNITFIQIPEIPVSKCYTDEFSFILKPSKIAGVGVFVTHKIQKDTRLRIFGGEPTRKMKVSEIQKNPVLAKFVEFF